MLKPILLAAVIAAAAPAYAATVGVMAKYRGITAADVAKLPPQDRQAWQDYLARSAAAHQHDLDTLQTELQGMVSAPAPVGDSMHDHSMPLSKPTSWYASAEARHEADIIVSFQTPSGGWGKNQDFSKASRLKGQMWVVLEGPPAAHPEAFGKPGAGHWHYVGTIDNDATYLQLRFLARVITAAGSADSSAWRASFLKGIDYLLAAEFPGGGWPQVWPLESGYHDALTYNDNAVANAATILAQVAGNTRRLYSFVPESTRLKAAAAVRRAEAVLLKTQVVVDGKRTIWGQQYDPLTHEVVGARNFEPAALAASESVALLNFLMSDPDPSPEVVAAVHDGIAFLKNATIHDKGWSQTGSGRILTDQPGAILWARYYDLKTLKPVFGDRDQTIHDNVNELTGERLGGYSWYNALPEKALKTYESWSKLHPVT